MKQTLGTILLAVTGVFNCFGQTLPQKNSADTQQAIIKKQAAVSNLEVQIRDVPYSTVRSYVRSQVAAWLWQKGKDDTGQAEDLAVRAFEEIYERKSEIPTIYFLSLKSEILTLLETNSPAAAQKLVKKYNIGDEEDLDSAYSLLDSKDGEKRVAEKIKTSLANQAELSSTMLDLINELASRKSAELPAVLSQMLGLEETGRSDFSPDSLFFVVNVFRNSLVSNDLRSRFYHVVLKKAVQASASNGTDLESVYNLLCAISEDISKNAPTLMPEAAALEAALKGRVNNSIDEDNKVYERIEKSADPLSTMISEAEAAENKALKKGLYRDASLLALKKKKFRLAVELMEKSQIDENLDDENNKSALRWHDQFLGDVSEQSLKVDDVDSSKYASGKIIDKLTRADVLKKTAIYFFEKQNSNLAADTLDEALKITNAAENSPLKIRVLLRLIPAFQKISKIQLADVTEKTAKAINSLPTLDIEDKPETENYKKYVSSVMIIDINLLSAISYLVKENKSEAIDLAGRINRREVKIVADYAILTDSIK